MKNWAALIVDDDTQNAETLKALLTESGITNQSFDNFDSAYKSITSDKPCLALIDLRVPGRMSAAEFISEAKKNHPDLPIVIVSIDTRVRTAAESLDVYFLSKPYRTEDVTAMIKEVCLNGQ